MRRKAKILALILTALVFACSVAVFFAMFGVVYHQALVITDVEGSVASLQTASGLHSYKMKGAEDLLPGDVVAALMYSRLTWNVSDDIVIAGTVRCS